MQLQPLILIIECGAFLLKLLEHCRNVLHGKATTGQVRCQFTLLYLPVLASIQCQAFLDQSSESSLVHPAAPVSSLLRLASTDHSPAPKAMSTMQPARTTK